MAGNKLSAKAARLDFSRLPGAVLPPATGATGDEHGGGALLRSPGSPGLATGSKPASVPGHHVGFRAKTAPGAMMAYANDARSELVRENEELRERAAQADSLRGQLGDALNDLALWDGAKAARLLDARLVVPSAFANRHEASYAEPAFQSLKLEIENAGGNVQPVKVRLLRPGKAHSAAAGSEHLVASAGPGQGGGAVAQYELVFGHRRHRACLELGLPLLAVVDHLDDQALFVEMERENRARKDLSAWEQGRMYRQALSEGLFPSNRKLAEAIGVDLSALGKALVLADLPAAVVAAFSSPLDLQFRWAKPLADAVAQRPEQTLSAARGLAHDRAGLSPKQVLTVLTTGRRPGVERFHPEALATEALAQAKVREWPLKRADAVVGRLLVDVQGRVSVQIDSDVLAPEAMQGLAAWMQRYLDQGGGH